MSSTVPTNNIRIENKGYGVFDIYDGEKINSDLQLLYFTESTADNKTDYKRVDVYGKLKDDYTPVIVISMEGQKYIYYLEKCGGWFPIVYLENLDEDDNEEIIIDHTISGTDTGEYFLHILKIADNTIKVLYKFPDKSGNNLGFNDQLLVDKKLVIKSAYFDFETVVDLSNKMIPLEKYYDWDGMLLQKVDNLLVYGSFCTVQIEDYDNDDNLELIVTQNIGLENLRYGLGYFRFALDYNKDEKRFDTQLIGFEEY